MPRRKLAVGAAGWGQAQKGVKQLQAWWAASCSVWIVSGTIEGQMSEVKLARLVALSFGVLWIVILVGRRFARK